MRGLREREGHQLIPLGRAAREIGLGPSVLYAARRRGEIPTYEIGGRSYITLARARAWLEKHRHPSDASDASENTSTGS
jgi:hypothetical protein